MQINIWKKMIIEIYHQKNFFVLAIKNSFLLT